MNQGQAERLIAAVERVAVALEHIEAQAERVADTLSAITYDIASEGLALGVTHINPATERE
jgi:hypothetical protein